MDEATVGGRIRVLKLCAGSYLLQVPEEGISWLFNAWPDSAKFIIQRKLELNGIVYPDLRFQGEKGTSCNLVEFPLLHALFNQGMLFRGEKPCLLGTPRQLELASESFRRGMFGFYDVAEMADCDLEPEACHRLLDEIVGLAPRQKIEPTEAMLDLIPLAPLENAPTQANATQVRGVRVWKEALNVFGVRYGDEEVFIDCNLTAGEQYMPPLELDVKQFSYELFQIVDTGEEDGFSPKSCMHTLIQWRDRLICIDLPMNVSFLLDRVSVSRFEIDAVLFTHNHDDHIGDLAMLLQMDKKVTVICPKIVWRSILLKGSAMLDMDVEELAAYFDYVPIRYGEELDYAGLRILAHPSIHSVPCAVYRLRGIVGREWQSYGHMSDILNFQRCRSLVKQGVISQQRFDEYRDFLLAPTTVKKIDVGATAGTEETSVHGFWRDFEGDRSEHIVLGHIRKERLDERATVTVGQVAVAGSAREVGDQSARRYGDKYRERALKYLADCIFALVAGLVDAGRLSRQQVLSYVHIMADCPILVIQPNTPFMKAGDESSFVDLVISGSASVWSEQDGEWMKVAHVNAGDLIGDMGVLRQVPRAASIRSDTYMRVLRIPGFLFRESTVLLGVFHQEAHLEGAPSENTLQRIWRRRELLQGSRLLSAEVPIYLQNRIAQHVRERHLAAGDAVAMCEWDALVLGTDVADYSVTSNRACLTSASVEFPVFGECFFLDGNRDPYQVTARREHSVLVLRRDEFAWIADIPVFRLRLRQLSQHRAMLCRWVTAHA